MNQHPHHCPSTVQPSSLRVLPVIDLRGGRAVHARGGRRDAYPALNSLLSSGDDPLELAIAFRDRLGLDEFYLADLDAIMGAPPNLSLIRRITEAGLKIWVDAGVRDASALDILRESGVGTIIVATETLAGPEELAKILETSCSDVVFGLDLRNGEPVVAPGSNWDLIEPSALIEKALTVGVRRLLILDTARVGSGRGLGTIPMIADLKNRPFELEIAVGGGIAGPRDLYELERLGVSVALVGSALHDGRITRMDLDALG